MIIGFEHKGDSSQGCGKLLVAGVRGDKRGVGQTRKTDSILAQKDSF